MKDPDNGEINLGTYRVMVHDKNTAGIFIAMAHTGNIIARKYWAKGQSCPVVVACGERTEAFGPALIELQAAALPHARTEVLPGLGHFGPLEDPGLVAASIRRAFADG